MRSPLEILAGRFDHALLTTYSFNLSFFETRVLPALWEAEVRNVVVFVDSRELAHALGDTAPALAGRAYHVVSGSAAKAAFHPKVLLVAGPESARLCVSSANLTADGQLRNAESAIAFDSQLAGQLRPVLDAGEFFRRLSEDAPAYTAAAIQQALDALPEDSGEESPYRLVHNLDRPLIDSFPEPAPTRAVAPFVDADGRAARRLHERGPLTAVVDAERVAASAAFFTGPWEVDARSFEARLHGKAYEVSGSAQRWVLIGSPNLSEAALLRPASAGNLEVAAAVAASERLELPESKPWEGGELAELAEDRLAVVRRDADERESLARAFNAWEEEERIVVDGVPDGTRIERWESERWIPLGRVTDGGVLISRDVRPSRVRAVGEDGRIAFAVVGHPAQLRARMRARGGGRQTTAAEKLPLDLETVRALEGVLSELYALSEVAGQAGAPGPRRPPGGKRHESEDEAGLLGWMPRNPDEGPRVPPVYSKAWKGEPDALLALVGRILRLESEPEEVASAEAEVMREGLDIEELEEITSEEEVGVEPEETDLTAGKEELERYRREFLRLFDRGLDFVRSTKDPTLAAWAFTYLLRLVEDLGSHHVKVEGREEPLMRRAPLRDVSLDLLETYLGRNEHDLLCLATARAHLAAAIRDRSRYSLRDAERLDALAHSWAAEFVELEVPEDVPTPPKESLGLDTSGALAWLDEYAGRSRWEGVEEEASAHMEEVRFEAEPWPMIVGHAAFDGRMDSPGWSLLAFSAPVGYDTHDPFGVVVTNTASSPVGTHVLVCDPQEHEVIEAFKRTADGVWLERRYSAPNRSSVESAGPTTLEPATPMTDLAHLEEGSDTLQRLAPLLEAVVGVA